MFSWFKSKKNNINEAPPLEKERASFSVIINYVTSFIKSYGNTNYAFINLSIENKSEQDIDDMIIETIPHLPQVNDLKYKAIEEKWTIDRFDPALSDTISSRVMNIEPGAIISGYLIVVTPGTDCNVTELSFIANGQKLIVPVRKDRVVMKTGNIRKF